jgi:ribonuclease-3
VAGLAARGGASELERRLGHTFARPELLHRALTHRSFSADHNERLEFLGDGVLNFAVASLLYQRFPGMPEGELSRLRASLVRQGTLHELAVGLGLGPAIRLGEGERKSGGVSRPSILADALEAVLGAAYLDGGFDVVSEVVERLWSPLLAHAGDAPPSKDPKTALQEYLQGRHLPLPIYSVLDVAGLAHQQLFRVECRVSEPGLVTVGDGVTRRAAEQAAAQAALDALSRGKAS